MKDMISGQYLAGNSVIHRLDPRSKLLGCLAMIIAIAWPRQQIYWLIFDLLMIIFFIYISQVGVGRVLRGLSSLKMLFLLTFLCQAFLTRGDPLWSWGSIAISKPGIYLGFSTFIRLTILYMGTSLLTMTTSTLKLSAGIESLLSPLRKLGLPVQQFAMIINISLRFIPTIIEEAELIVRAQKSRGAQFDSGPLIVRLKTIITLLIPLLAASLQRATDLALAMESRCYTGDGENLSRLRSLHYSWRDGIAIGIVLLVFLLPLLC